MPTIQVDFLMTLIRGGGDPPDLEVEWRIIHALLIAYRTYLFWEWTLQRGLGRGRRMDALWCRGYLGRCPASWLPRDAGSERAELSTAWKVA